jgi:23S rRNA maturation mini-RNase III
MLKEQKHFKKEKYRKKKKEKIMKNMFDELNEKEKNKGQRG